MDFPEGEGGVSAGAMIPVHDASTEEDARAVVELLETHAVPAVVDRDVAGAVFSWQVASSNNRVLVPSQMLKKSIQILHRYDYQTIGGPRKAQKIGLAFSVPPMKAEPARVSDFPGVEARTHGFEDRAGTPVLERESDIAEEDAPLDIQLPEPSPLGGRMIKALLAIAFGTSLQRALEFVMQPKEILAKLGARSPLLDEPWRLVTAGFMHGSVLHFVSNGLFGLMIGVVLFGTHLFGATAFVWLMSSIVGLISETTLSSSALVIGASAGNYGLVGLWARGQLQRARLSLLPSRERIRTIGLLLLLVPGALTPVSSTGSKIAVVAHAAGFFTGFLLGFFFRRRLQEEAPALERRSRAAGVAAAAIALAAFAFAAKTVL